MKYTQIERQKYWLCSSCHHWPSLTASSLISLCSVNTFIFILNTQLEVRPTVLSKFCVVTCSCSNSRCIWPIVIYAGNGVGFRAKPHCPVGFRCTSVDLCCALSLQSSPVTTVTSPNSTPAKTIDTSPPVDLFATASAAVPVRSVHEYVDNWSQYFDLVSVVFLCIVLMPHGFTR